MCLYITLNSANFTPDLNKTTLSFGAEKLLIDFTPNYTISLSLNIKFLKLY